MELQTIFKDVRNASRKLTFLSDEQINRVLCKTADALERNAAFIIEENRKDLTRMDKDNPKYDRLLLTEERLRSIANDQRNVAKLPSPLGKVLSSVIRPNGMQIDKVSVPFGVIGIIYEARPNVTVDVFSLCLKAGNACLLKGGHEADASNRALVQVIHSVLAEEQIDQNVLTLLPPEREATTALLHANGWVDLLIPRGSASLIRFVREEATLPVIETGAGICHTYFDREGDLNKGASIIFNAKTRRVSVCNALDCLIIHRQRINELPALCQQLATKEVKIYADEPAYQQLCNHYPEEYLYRAQPDNFGTEYLSYVMAIKTVNSLEEALQQIAQYSSKHSECIVTESDENRTLFCKQVDAACVYCNVSTAFTDGAQFGLGAEIGISTQKLHARGPMGLEELTTYKWIVTGNGQTREP